MEKDQLRIKMTGRRQAIPSGSLLVVISSVLHILKDVEIAYSEDSHSTLEWSISHISMNSPLQIDLFPMTESTEDYGRAVLRASMNGLRQVQDNADAIPKYFRPKTLSAVRRLANVLNDGIGAIELSTPYSQALELSLQLVTNVENIIASRRKAAYTDFGEFEGRLAEMSDHGRHIVKIEDNIYGYITCTFPPDLVSLLKDNLFTERVLISGETSYSASGHPLSIRVEAIRRLRRREELPQFKDLESLNLSVNENAVFEGFGGLISAE